MVKRNTVSQEVSVLAAEVKSKLVTEQKDPAEHGTVSVSTDMT